MIQFWVVQAAMMLLIALPIINPVGGGGTEQEILKALAEVKEDDNDSSWQYVPLSGPTFVPEHSRNVTAQVGTTAILNCRILYLGGKAVSWMRSRDLHLLTVGRFTYTSDDRFKALHQPGSKDWLLKIHYVQERDSGIYECQVSTTPPMSHLVHLNVIVETQTVILGGPDLFINSGSTINLTCIVRHSQTPPPYILWFHEDTLLSYDSPRGGITVVTERGKVSSSRLLIQKAKATDSGRYSCRPAMAPELDVNVHVISSEEAAAAIHQQNNTSSNTDLQLTSAASSSSSAFLYSSSMTPSPWSLWWKSHRLVKEQTSETTFPPTSRRIALMSSVRTWSWTRRRGRRRRKYGWLWRKRRWWWWWLRSGWWWWWRAVVEGSWGDMVLRGLLPVSATTLLSKACLRRIA